jgi:SpoVK/Ycf46/Vps4 family AAA+-type ATPase
LRQNLDPAFLRRIRKLVDFPKPDEASRALIWQRTLPAGVLHPPDAVIQELARRFHKLTGGNIHNAVVDATYRAVDADPDTPRIEARHLVAGVAREYQKLGEPLTRGEFGAEFYNWLTDDILSDPDGPS